MKKYVVVNLCITVFVYLAGWFVSYDPIWFLYDDITRFAVISTWGVLSITQVGFYEIDKEYRK